MDQQFHDSVVSADRWSKVVAMFVAIGVFFAARELVGDPQFSAIVAAFVGIGVRLYIPHHASLRVPESERTPLGEHPVTGDYHHGAAGVALAVSPFVSLLVFFFGHGFLTAVGFGALVCVLLYLLVGSVLPS
ncbi:MAG: hypothetical protein PPP58_09145 [Natronomonas sp.]